MKYVIVHAEGLAGAPVSELGGRTALQAASTPMLDTLASQGDVGTVSFAAEGLRVTREAVALALLGYDPRKHLTGPAAFEAASLGVALGEHDVAYRCTLVTLRPAGSPRPGSMAYPEIKKLSAHLLLEDATAGGITSDEAREFIDAINEQLGSESVQFYPGSAHRHLMVWVGGKSKAICVDPAHGVGKPVDKLLPSGDGADILKNVMEASAILLSTHPLNDPRYDSGAKPVNCVWLWGQGKAVKLPKFTERQALSGAVMAECELHRGVGVTAGLDAPQVEETVGSHEERYATLCRMVLDDASKRDFLYVHVQVGDGSEGGGTVKSIEALDRLLIGPLVERLKKQGNGRVLVVADRVCAPDGTVDATGPIPYVLWDAAAPSSDGTGRRLTESDAVATAVVREGTKLFNRLVANKTA